MCVNLPSLSRATAVRLVALLLVVSLLAPSAVSALTYDPSEETSLERGNITSPANNSTVISVQGYTFQGNTNPKKPARLVSVDERGNLEWTHNDTVGGNAWFFDVDPMPNGNLLVSSPRAGDTVVFELDPDTQERVWQERFEMTDTHDVAYLGDDRIAIANMRQWNESAGRSDDRIVVYNRSSEEFTWEWYFRNHYPESTDGGYSDDWTHVNDVDQVGEDRLLISPRNFDQAIVVDMESKEIVERLGSDGNYSVMREQHNPDWLLSEDGDPTILVADSENNRVVEYAKEDGEWVRTWEVGSNTLTWPRDADRLPNGNTLITDSLNTRVVEVDADGDVVWSISTDERVTSGPGIPYEADRLPGGEIEGRYDNASATGGESLATVSANASALDDTGSTVPGLSLAVAGLTGTFGFVPYWFGEFHLAVTIVALLAILAGAVDHLRTGRRVELPSP